MPNSNCSRPITYPIIEDMEKPTNVRFGKCILRQPNLSEMGTQVVQKGKRKVSTGTTSHYKIYKLYWWMLLISSARGHESSSLELSWAWEPSDRKGAW